MSNRTQQRQLEKQREQQARKLRKRRRVPRELPERQDQTHHNANTGDLNDDQANQ
jgi:hypothetical protein